MFYLNTNYHELIINPCGANYMINYMEITC